MMLNPLRIRALTAITTSTTTRQINTASSILQSNSNPLSNPPKSQSATAQQHPSSPSSSSSSSSSNSTESPGPGSSSGSPSKSVLDSKPESDGGGKDAKEASESRSSASEVNSTQYGTGEAVEGSLTEESGEKERKAGL